MIMAFEEEIEKYDDLRCKYQAEAFGMKKLIAFLMFLLATIQGATAQEVSGQQIPLSLDDDYKNTEFLPVAPSYSDILMMKSLSSSEFLAMPITPLTPMPFATEPPLANKYDASHSGSMSMEVSKYLKFTAVGTYRSYIGLMDVQSVSGYMQYSLGALNMQGGLIANRYLYHRGIISQYGISGQIVYSFNPNLSATIFGTYYNTNPFISMAAFPFVPTTSYGGYMTVGNNSFYMNLGVERRYNTFERKMETVPIISPAFKISNKVTVELPLGDLVKHVVEDILVKNR